MRLFDSHAHLDMTENRERASIPVSEMIANAKQAGLVGIMAIGGADTPGEYKKTLDIVEHHEWIWAAVGIHPHEAKAASGSVMERLRFALEHPRVLAIGEIGLDYHYNISAPREQRAAFINQMRIAHEISLPVIIHTREAESDTLAILRDGGADKLGGVIHCFTASADFAAAVLDLGLYISFSGMITFPKADDLREIAEWIPDDRILAETDTPFLSPVPLRGRPNEPARIAQVVKKLAEIRRTSPEEMAERTDRNTRRCFRISG